MESLAHIRLRWRCVSSTDEASSCLVDELSRVLSPRLCRCRIYLEIFVCTGPRLIHINGYVVARLSCCYRKIAWMALAAPVNRDSPRTLWRYASCHNSFPYRPFQHKFSSSGTFLNYFNTRIRPLLRRVGRLWQSEDDYGDACRDGREQCSIKHERQSLLGPTQAPALRFNPGGTSPSCDQTYWRVDAELYAGPFEDLAFTGYG